MAFHLSVVFSSQSFSKVVSYVFQNSMASSTTLSSTIFIMNFLKMSSLCSDVLLAKNVVPCSLSSGVCRKSAQVQTELLWANQSRTETDRINQFYTQLSQRIFPYQSSSIKLNSPCYLCEPLHMMENFCSGFLLYHTPLKYPSHIPSLLYAR